MGGEFPKEAESYSWLSGPRRQEVLSKTVRLNRFPGFSLPKKVEVKIATIALSGRSHDRPS